MVVTNFVRVVNSSIQLHFKTGMLRRLDGLHLDFLQIRFLLLRLRVNLRAFFHELL